jgi:hypothetical protein
MTYLWIGLIVLALILLYKWYLKPRKELTHYAQLFRKQGYRVVEKPYQPYTAPFYDELFDDSKVHGDPFYTHKE